MTACTDEPVRPPVDTPDLGTPDSGPDCREPADGCPCTPGTEPVECAAAPTTIDGELFCQHGTRTCTDGQWGACENITQYLPPKDKDLGQPARVSDCLPDNFLQIAVPELVDVQDPTHGTNVDYRAAGTSGVILSSPQSATNNFGLGVDTDGDGAPDTVDQCPTTNGWAAPCDGDPTNDGFFHILRPGDTTADPLAVVVPTPPADVYVLADNGATMSQELAALQAGFAAGTLRPGCGGGLLGAIGCELPGAMIGLGMAGDFPAGADANDDDFPFAHLLDPTANTALATTVVGQFQVEANPFHPQATSQALYALGSGVGLGGFVPGRACAAGSGYACFTAGRTPIVLLAGDAPFWSGTSGVGSYAAFAGTNGSGAMAGQAFGQGRVLSTTGAHYTTADGPGAPFTLGDVTTTEVTALGSTAGMADDHTTACGGTAQNGGDLYYEFTTTANAPLVLEASGDFDASLALLDGAGTEVGCDLDSGARTDAAGGTMFDLGARLDVRTITGPGVTTETSTFNGCTVGSQTTNVGLTGCNVTQVPNTVDLASCVVDQVPSASTLTGCQVQATPRTSTLAGCGLESTATPLTVTGCGFGTTTATSTFAGCTPSGNATNLTFSGCLENNTATVSGCVAQSGTANTTFSGCAASTSMVNFSGCTPSGATSTNLTFSGCTATGSAISVPLASCSYPVTATASLTACDLAVSNVTVANCTVGNGANRNRITCTGQPRLPLRTGMAVTSVTGTTGYAVGTTISTIAYAGTTYTITLSANGTAAGTGSVTFNGTTAPTQLFNCQGTGLVAGMALVGTGIPAGTLVSSFTGAGTAVSPYVITMSASGTTNSANATVTRQTLNRLQVTCTATGTPVVGMNMVGANPAATVSSMTLVSGSTYTFTLSQSQSVTTGVPTVTAGAATAYTGFTGCTATGGTPYVGMGITGASLPGGSTIASLSGGPTYTVGLSTPVTLGMGAPTLTSGTGTTYSAFTNCTALNSGSIIQGLTVTGSTGLASGTTINTVTGTGPYSFSLSQPSTSATPSLTQLTGVTGATGCSSTGFQPTSGMSLSGAGMTVGTTAASTAQAGSTWSLNFDRAQAAGSSLASGSYTGLVQLTNCTIADGAFVGMQFSGSTGVTAGTTVTAVSGTGPYILSVDRVLTSGAASPASASYVGFFRGLTNCTVAGGTPVNGMTITGGVPGGTINTSVSGGPAYSFRFNNWLTTGTNVTGATYIPAYTRFTGCVASGDVPQAGFALTGTGLPVTPTVGTATLTGPSTYTIDVAGGALSGPAATLLSASGTITDLDLLTNCTVAGGTPSVGAFQTLAITGPAIPGGTTVTSVTGVGPYTLQLSAPASSANSTVGTLTRTTYNPSRLACTSASGDAPVVGMTLTGAGLAGGTTVTGITGTGPYAFDLSAPATVRTATATSGAYTTYNRSILTNCGVASGIPPSVGMTVTGVGLTVPTTVTAVTGAGPYQLTLDTPALTDTSRATAGLQQVATNTLSACQIAAAGPLMVGMTVTGTRLPPGATVTGFTGSGTAVDPYLVTLSTTPTSYGATTASGLLFTPGNTLTGCALASGGPLIPGMALTGARLAGGTTLVSASGAAPYTLTLNQNAASLGTTAVSGTITLPTATLTGCTLAPGSTVVRAGMDLAGTGIAAGTTLGAYTGTGTGPYTFTMSQPGSAVGATTLTGTFTGAPLLYPQGLPAGTYRLVVDSASAAQGGAFQLRITSPLSGGGAATTATEVGYGAALAALTGIGAKAVPVMSCEGGCTNLTALQNAYDTCVTGADGTGGSGPCGVAYGTCMAAAYADATLCAAIHTACLAAEVAAGGQGATPVRACADAETACLEGYPVCAKVRIASCTTNAAGDPVDCYQDDPTCATAGVRASTACSALRTACAAATPVCATEAGAVSTCRASNAAAGAPANTLCDEAVTDLTGVATGTGSVRADGTAIAYRVGAGAGGFGLAAAAALHDVAATLPNDVTTSCTPTTAGACAFFSGMSLDTTATSPVRTVDPRCGSCSGTGCLDCTAGTNIPFQIGLTGAVPWTLAPQIFDFSLSTADQAGTALASVPVRVVVPPQVVYATAGSFEQTFDGTESTVTGAGCPYQGSGAFWGNFTYTANVPAGTQVLFTFYAGDSSAEVNAATALGYSAPAVTATTTNGVIDVAALLLANGVPSTAPFLRVKATLLSNTAQTLTPTLTTYQMAFACVDIE